MDSGATQVSIYRPLPQGLSYTQERLHLEDQEFSSYRGHLTRGDLLRGLFSTGLFYQSTEKTGGWINYSSFDFKEILSRGSPTYRPLLHRPFESTSIFDLLVACRDSRIFDTRVFNRPVELADPVLLHIHATR